MSAAMCILQFTYLCRVIVSAIDIPSVILIKSTLCFSVLISSSSTLEYVHHCLV